MSSNRAEIPVVLFAYNRPQHVCRTLSCLQKNHVPLIYAFSDGPRSSADRPLVEEVRSVLRAVDWCEVKSVERSENLGLGRSILTGVTEIFQRHEAAVVSKTTSCASRGPTTTSAAPCGTTGTTRAS